MATDDATDDHNWLILIIIGWILISWMFQEICERKLGLSPNIISDTQIQQISDDSDQLKINKQLTKSLDVYSKFRIQPRASIYFIKAMFAFTMFIAITCSLYLSKTSDTNNTWFIDHYIKKNFDIDPAEVKVDYVWQGILGKTKDAMPFVGPLKDRNDRFICAGFNGHGMPICFNSAKVLCDIMMGKRPKQFVTKFLPSSKL